MPPYLEQYKGNTIGRYLDGMPNILVPDGRGLKERNWQA